jgi:hypothetical protein
MNIVVLNYRKAKSKDTPCRCCEYSAAPKLHQNQRRLRCLYKGRDTIVGLHTTCDKAEKLVVPF